MAMPYNFMKAAQPPSVTPEAPSSRVTTPGTQPQVGKPKKQPAKASTMAVDLSNGFAGAKRVAKASANKKGKEVVPRAKIETRANPKAEY